MKKNNDTYPWQFASVGGTVRVKIRNGEDIRHLPELDRKMWTVLSCPVSGLEFDEKTLKLIDTDADGKIRVDEVIKTAQWLTRIVKNADDLLKENDSLKLADFNTADPDGARLEASARQILKNLKLEKDEIALEDTADNVKIFAETKFNGDGIITPASADDEATAKLIETIAGIASATDRSGVAGITAEQIEAFYTACADFAAWKEAGTKEVFPFGDKTADALAAVNALKDKVADYFMRCKLIGFDPATAGAVDVSVDKIAAIEGNLAAASGEIGLQPLAKPAADGKLVLAAVNPAWKGAVDAMVSLTGLDKEAVTEADWADLIGKFAPYTAWLDAKKGAEVEALGLEAVSAILKEDKKAALLELVEKDKAEEANALSIEEVDKVLRLNKYFYRFLNNYVVLADFYDPAQKAVFQAGRLYIDQRSTDLCVKVAGPAPEISSLSGMYILYCACTSEKLGKSFNIAAVLTDGDVDGLREGKNAVFYDREGNDYTAKVIAIVDNPISVRQAFWTPYKKVARMVSDRVDKKAAEKNEKSMTGLTEATNTAADGKAPAAPFDIAKFAGIFAAVSMGIGLVGAAIAGIASALKGITFWQVLIIIAVVMLLISGPSMFIAWRKLRRRDLGPVLNANGWAINAKSLVSVKFGKTLTSLAKYPKLTAVDPEARRKSMWRRFWCCLCGAVIIACVALWLCNVLAPIGIKSPLPRYKETVEVPAETPAEAPAEAPAADAAAPQEEPAPVAE
ncbi:MAG: hypothetical protein IJ623_05630 [Bacteroidales bacterium]|nr:hypothetical protein [Bacteroidales bacterium]